MRPARPRVESPDERAARARFEALFADHHEAVLRYARRRTDADTALEVTGNTFLTAWRRLDDVPAPALPWLYAVARRRNLANARRQASRRLRTEERLAGGPPLPAVPDHANRVTAADEVDALLASIPEREREALLLMAWEGLQIKEAARVVGCSPGVLRARLFRLRRRMHALTGTRTLTATTAEVKP